MQDHPVILYDGICNFCNGAVNFLIRQDRKAIFRFAPLQSETGLKLRADYQIHPPALESFALIQNGKVYQKSTAALKVLDQLPWYWKALQVFWMVPKPVRDAMYDFVAKNRYRWFGKKEQCPIPSPEVRGRFLA